MMSENSTQIDANAADLIKIPIDKIRKNPDNPRIIFRQEEFDQLLESIRKHGIQVPISVYKKGHNYVLIDGERRWRCCLKLNKTSIPALVQPAPTRLQNVLMMFNIHALREQWDLLTVALKLDEIIELLGRKFGKTPTELQLAQETGLSRGIIRRCRYLLNLPQVYKDMILDELRKPKGQQRLTEDFFIEMERALKTVERAMPSVIENTDQVRDILIRKFRDGTINNRVDFRKVAKIARAEKVDADDKTAESVLERLFQRNKYSITEAYDESVSAAYTERDLLTRINALSDRLDALDPTSIDEELRLSMLLLIKRMRLVLGGKA